MSPAVSPEKECRGKTPCRVEYSAGSLYVKEVKETDKHTGLRFYKPTLGLDAESHDLKPTADGVVPCSLLKIYYSRLAQVIVERKRTVDAIGQGERKIRRRRRRR
jgi:hypothetical protein